MATDLQKEVKDILDDYTNDIKDILDENAKTVAKEVAKKVKGSAPRRTGQYASGITYRQTNKSRTGSAYTVLNSKKPQLTHLLEHGHAKVNGGYVGGFEHWGPAETMGIEEYEERVVNAIK